MKEILISLLVVFMFFAASDICRAQSRVGPDSFSLAGFVADSLTDEPISEATVIISGDFGGRISDSLGCFLYQNLPAGKYKLTISHISYKTKQMDITITAEPADSITIRLERKVIPIKSITVTSERYQAADDEPSSKQNITRQEITALPQLGDDFMRAISRLPGIGSNDYSTRITVRGGDFDELLVTLDGMQLYEPFHVRDLDGGAISIIDVAAIKEVDIITGGFPANYGDKMSGVLNIKSRDVEPGQYKMSAGLSLLNLKLHGEGVFQNDKGSWLLSMRRGYVDYVLKLIDEDEELDPTYYDIYSKMQYKLGGNNTISANVLHAGDRLNFVGHGKYEGQRLVTKYNNSYGWFSLKSERSEALSINTIFSFGSVNHTRYETYHAISSSLLLGSTNDTVDFKFTGIKSDVELKTNDFNTIKLGAEYRYMTCDYFYLNQEYDYTNHPIYGPILSRIDSIQVPLKKSGHRFAAYIADRIELLSRIDLEIGLRGDAVSYSGDGLVSPRLNIAYNLNEGTVFRTGWGVFYQSEEIDDIKVGDGETGFSPAEKAEHWVAGLRHVFKNGIRFNLEGYYKKYSDLRPEPRNTFYDIEAFPEYNQYRTIYYRSGSTARGIEFYIENESTRKFSWWFSYGLAWADDDIDSVYFPAADSVENRNDRLPSPMDQRHSFYLDVSYHPSKAWQVNVAWQYHTGQPYTALVPIENDWVYDGQMNARHNPYSRFDLRINRYFDVGKGQIAVFVEMINVLDKNNVRSYDYRTVNTGGSTRIEKVAEHWFGILPSAGIRYQVNF